MELVALVGVVVLLIGALMWTVRQMVRLTDAQMTLAREIIRPQQPDPPPPAAEPPTLRAAAPPVDPTDLIIPDVMGSAGSPASLADAFPTVDPWLIGEPEYPETINDTTFDPDEFGPAQVMDTDGNWVPITEAADRKDERE